MLDAISDVPGITVGHAQDAANLTGCTVVLAGAGAVVGADVRGLAPGTRETDLCRPGTLVEHAQAVLLTGGSAFGLEAAAGVMRFLRERGLGFDAGGVKVPIVPGAVIFDIGAGQAVWPDAEMGYRACSAATNGRMEQGNVGAGTGATLGRFLGPESTMKGGVGTASRKVGKVTVGAVMVVNAVGNVVDSRTGVFVAGARSRTSGQIVGPDAALLGDVPASNTVIGVLATDAPLSSVEVNRLATVAHDGLARAVYPVHTLYDGDVIFSLATGAAGDVKVHPVTMHVAVLDVVERAVLNAVLHARSVPGYPAARDLRKRSSVP
jgi:L-aminopeptidase/D-esterase-like protein